MPWSNNGGGGWQGGGGNDGRGPWGQGGGGNKRPNNGGWQPGGGGGGGNRPPDIDEVIRNAQQKFKGKLPNGLGGIGFGAIILVLAGLWLASGFYRVEANQRGVELVFGKYHETTTPGLQYNWPAPIGSVERPEFDRQRQTEVGATLDERLMLTGDENIVDVEFSVLWKINNAQNFLFNVDDPERVVKVVAESAMREVVGSEPISAVITTDKSRIQTQVGAIMQDLLNEYGAGVEINSVVLNNAFAPEAVRDAFLEVVSAVADRERLRNEAEAYQNEIIPRARGEAEQMRNEAEAYREQRIAQAEGEVARYLGVVEQYQNAGELVRRRIYLETLQDVYGGMDKVIIDSGNGNSGVLPYLPLQELINKNKSAN